MARFRLSNSVMAEHNDSLKGLFRFGGGEATRPRASRLPEPASGMIPGGLAGVVMVLALAFAVVARFYDLASKPLHHDESLFAYYSYYLARGFGYQYQPILHGPVLEHVTALVFLLFGDNEWTMRLPAALGSLGLFAALIGWRRYLGSMGAMTALVLFAVSPTITYYSRFLRNDAPYLAATVWCAYATLRAFETGERRYFWYAGLAATLMFCMMESSIFFFATCAGYLALIILVDLIRGPWRSSHSLTPSSRYEFPGRAVFFAPLSKESREAPPSWRSELGTLALSFLVGLVAALALAYLYVRVLSDSLPMPGWRREGATWYPSLVSRVLQVMPLAAIFCIPLAVLAGVNWHTPRGERGTLYYVLRVCWHRRWTLLGIGAVAVLAYTTLFTTYFTHTSGPDFFGQDVRWTPLQIYKNTWDYWWDQHRQHRIKGPFHYYWPILLLYELPALLVVAGGLLRSLFAKSTARLLHGLALLLPPLCLLAFGLAGGFAGWDWVALDSRWHVSHPFHLGLVLLYLQLLVYVCAVLVARRRMVEAFLVFWMVSTVFAYSYAGEKVPWLSIHTAGPAILLAGYYFNLWAQQNPLLLRRPLFLVLTSLALVWQVRSVSFVSWVHPWSPAERIVYNHTSPDVVRAVERIETLARESCLGPTIPMYVKGEMEWPLYWYLRRFSNWGPNIQEELSETSRPIVLVNWETVPDIPGLADQYEVYRLKVREWWEPPLLDFGALADIWRVLTPRESRYDPQQAGMTENGRLLQLSLQEWRKLWRYLAYREIWLDPDSPSFSNGANEFAFCVSKAFLNRIRDYLWLSAQPMRRDVPTSR